LPSASKLSKELLKMIIENEIHSVVAFKDIIERGMISVILSPISIIERGVPNALENQGNTF